jgi:hypothetical protein
VRGHVQTVAEGRSGVQPLDDPRLSRHRLDRRPGRRRCCPLGGPAGLVAVGSGRRCRS